MMNKMMLCVVDTQRAVHRQVRAQVVEAVVATLSAEPETLGELQAAVGRFIGFAPDRGLLDDWVPGMPEVVAANEIVIIDLAARLVVYHGEGLNLAATGTVVYHEGAEATGTQLRYHLSSDWLLSRDVQSWRLLSRRRRAQRRQSPPWDTRAVLYGKAPEQLVHECLAAARRHMQPTAAVPRSDRRGDEHADEIISAIHARWLTTPRDDLRGQAPRDVLLAHRDFLSLDMLDRCDHWTRLGQSPPGLARDSAAFRFAGYGTHEIVLYYELIRHLLWQCWDSLAGRPDRVDTAAEITWLDQRMQEWLHTPQHERLHGWTPVYVIDRERARLPLAVSDEEAIIDRDCPLCQMMAEEMGPMFMVLDDANMDDGFAFSLYPTREQWQQQQWEAFRPERELRVARDKPGGVCVEAASLESEPQRASVWDRTFSFSEPAATAGTAIFGIGACVAELVRDLKQEGSPGPFVAALNRDFGNLRSALNEPARCLTQPVLDRFCETLQAMAQSQPALAPKCDQLQLQLQDMARHLDDLPW